MNITCTKCGQKKSEGEFHWKKKKLGKRCSCCRDCKKKMQRQYYENNKESYLEKILETRKVRKTLSYDKVRKYLLLNPCVDCGEDDIRKLEFDHVRDIKKSNVCQMMHEGYSWETIEKEIQKCEIRCGSCHMVKTWPNRWQLNESHSSSG